MTGKIDRQTCNHNWATYDPTPGFKPAVFYPDGEPINQVCAKCGKKRVGYPQPIKWVEQDEE